ncbi:RagB/SusD family nutrient uptake outer membrane protein [Aureibaculum algae]|uniref:RagB/SusD family nutrient uptake outer membrane protein n=1 Tax=Aureibaculum algae TaxID=2584122 RepID=A0A5B7TSP5_9FLAO|nr:RagB/SusD family nutrient uptake outer membrane protein [Aureibaculum algae]QCX37672.1 RagB/SusD family nutrient uptake outer membrane protein [Aureibaculum algae]
MRSLYKLIGLLSLIGMMYSCEDYLDKTIETDLTVEEVFKNFENAQGFVEEMYAMIVDYSAPFWSYYSYYGEDSIGVETWIFDYSSDEGRYWDWQNDFNYFSGNPNTSSGLPFEKSAVWPSSWAGIRKANIVIASADSLMVDATQQQKDAILGQAYFFRGFFHHEIMKFWGPMPYIDHVLKDDWKLQRPTEWSETALKIDKDFDKAIALLPEDWDDSDWQPGVKTNGQNMFRLTKGAALAIKAKNLLFAASPLMQNSNDTYGYNVELCKQAADAFAKVIEIPRYQLVPWDNYESVFYSTDGKYSYNSEYIFGQSGFVGWFGGYMGDAWQLGAIGNSNAINSPTHNYIHNYFGMKDGLSCDESPLFDPNDPWANRDPRFYKWIVVDGDQLVDNLGAATGADAVNRYAEFYDGGAHRYPGKSNGTRTGYVAKKWYPRSFNKYDNQGLFAWRVHVRLTDVYLMYAEAAVMGYGINGKPSGFDLSAVDAINKIRERAMPDGSLNVSAINLTSPNVFMEEIRRERAMEMSWENHRWMDIRRWKQGTNMKYKLKTGLRFDRNASGKPINMVEEVLRTRVFDEKHYWLPLPKNDTELYEGFPQNPGW